MKLFFALAVPAAFVAWCVLGWQAASVTALGIFIFLILCATFAERPIIGAHGPCLPAASGIERSLEHATQGDGIRLPRVLIYENPLPNALVVRGMFGRGTVLLSQGLISLLREEELRQTLAGCLEELDQPGMVFRSTCSALAAICLRLAPAKWVGFMAGALQSDSAEVLSPQSGLGFLLVFPLLRFFLDLGRPMRPRDQAENDASHGIRRTLQFGGTSEFAGARHLYLFEPKSGQRLLPF